MTHARQTEWFQLSGSAPVIAHKKINKREWIAGNL